MTEIDPLVTEIQGAKVRAMERGLWETFRALDAAEKAIGNDLMNLLHLKVSDGGIVLGYTTKCEYCLQISCDKAPKWAPQLCDLRRVQIRGVENSNRMFWTRPQWVCKACRDYLKGLFKYVT